MENDFWDEFLPLPVPGGCPHSLVPGSDTEDEDFVSDYIGPRGGAIHTSKKDSRQRRDSNAQRQLHDRMRYLEKQSAVTA